MEKHHAKAKRGLWSSRLGFIMASAGSAVGLGNIWKFPYITGMHGGGAFVLFFIFCIAAVGIPIMIAEMVIGRHTHKDPVGAFRKRQPDPGGHRFPFHDRSDLTTWVRNGNKGSNARLLFLANSLHMLWKAWDNSCLREVLPSY